jgi:hypothetical protein
MCTPFPYLETATITFSIVLSLMFSDFIDMLSAPKRAHPQAPDLPSRQRNRQARAAHECHANWRTVCSSTASEAISVVEIGGDDSALIKDWRFDLTDQGQLRRRRNVCCQGEAVIAFHTAEAFGRTTLASSSVRTPYRQDNPKAVEECDEVAN